MSYYMRGDYYPPGYSVGDPFFGFLGPLISKAIPFVSKIVGHAPAPAQRITVKGAAEAAGRMIVKHPVLSAAGAAGAIGAAGMAGHAIAGHRKCKHVNPRTGKCVRRMRVTNTKALRRALRRAYGFERIAMRTIHLLHPRKKGRFGGFKKRRRAA